MSLMVRCYEKVRNEDFASLAILLENMITVLADGGVGEDDLTSQFD